MSGKSTVISDVPFGNNEWVATTASDAAGGHLDKVKAPLQTVDFTAEPRAKTLCDLVDGEQAQDPIIKRAIKIVYTAENQSSAAAKALIQKVEDMLGDAGLISPDSDDVEIRKHGIALATRAGKLVALKEELQGTRIADADLPGALREALDRITLPKETERSL